MLDNIYNNGTYATQYPDWHAEDSDWKAEHLVSLLDRDSINFMRRSTTLKIAEIGCGFGGVIAHIDQLLKERDINCQSTGYDISSHAVQQARLRHPEINFIQADILKNNQSYDLGLIVDLLEHLADPMALLTRVKARFCWLLFHIPLDEHMYGKYFLQPGRWYDYLWKDRGHLHYFTRFSALALLKSAGLHIIRWKYTPFGIELYSSESGRSAPYVRFIRLAGMRVCPDTCVRVMGGASLACFCHT